MDVGTLLSCGGLGFTALRRRSGRGGRRSCAQHVNAIVHQKLARASALLRESKMRKVENQTRVVQFEHPSVIVHGDMGVTIPVRPIVNMTLRSQGKAKAHGEMISFRPCSCSQTLPSCFRLVPITSIRFPGLHPYEATVVPSLRTSRSNSTSNNSLALKAPLSSEFAFQHWNFTSKREGRRRLEKLKRKPT